MEGIDFESSGRIAHFIEPSNIQNPYDYLCSHKALPVGRCAQDLLTIPPCHPQALDDLIAKAERIRQQSSEAIAALPINVHARLYARLLAQLGVDPNGFVYPWREWTVASFSNYLSKASEPWRGCGLNMWTPQCCSFHRDFSTYVILHPEQATVYVNLGEGIQLPDEDLRLHLPLSSMTDAIATYLFDIMHRKHNDKICSFYVFSHVLQINA
jgi:hypothetical protein